jgi:hypothetical protein
MANRRKEASKRRRFSLRRFISLALFLSFAGVSFTGVVLFISPPGRIARWHDWRIAGVDKSTYQDIHLVLAALFLLVGMVHLYYNWSSFSSYLRNPAKHIVLFTHEFTAALLIAALLILSAAWALPPVAYINDFAKYMRERHEEVMGSPPYGRAETRCLAGTADRLGMDLDTAISALREEGISVEDSALTLQEIAEAEGIAPSRIFRILREAAEELP